MRIPDEQQAIRNVEPRLAELLGAANPKVRERDGGRAPRADAIIEIAGATFVVEYRRSGATAPVSAAIEQVRRHSSAFGQDAIPLVVVPFMGPVGRRRCEESHVSWLDLSGNARIFAPGIRVLIEGQPNQYKSRGRRSSVFAPKSARITRWLLMHPHQPMAQREIAQATGMDEGFTSRIVSRLEEDDLIVRDPNGRILPRDPDLLLDAWREAYDFSRHQIFRGHVAARSGEDVLRVLADGLQSKRVKHATTGLSAAWLLTKTVGFRLATMYVAERPDSEVLEDLGLREEESGPNVWLVVPKDEGVFHGGGVRDGVECVHPVQVYLDLKGHPERAKEAADQLRSELLRWDKNG